MKIIFIISQGGFYVESQVLAFCLSLSRSLSLSHTHTAKPAYDGISK